MGIDHSARGAGLGVGGSACTMVDLLTQLGGRKERYLPALLCVAVSLALHALAGGASLLDPGRPGRAPHEPSETAGAQVADTELVELDALESEPVADSAQRGADERAQGSAPPAEPAAAAQPAEQAEAPAAPSPTPPPAATPAAQPAPSEPEPREQLPEPPPAPRSASAPARSPRPARPAASASSVPVASASANPSTGASGEAASATSPGAGRGDGPEGPGDGGGFERPRAPSAPARLTKELAAYAAPVVAWRELEQGPAGELRLQIELDDEGRIAPLERLCFAPTTPPEPLGESIRRSLRALRMPLAPPGSERAGAGRFELRIRASIDQVEVEATPGGDYRLESHFAGNRGHAAFVLESGRRVRFELELASGELGPCR